jgi:YidC/Oxa1 family membrane protein insertase
MFFGSLFQDVVVQPLMNILSVLYALLPGHNFGLTIILFTILIRILMWPLIKRQLHQAKVMRAMQPEIKRIKKAAGKDKQKESMMLMELYKERGVSPFGSLGLTIVQIIIFIGLYNGLSKVVANPQELIGYSYGFVRDLSWMQQLAADISRFDATFLGFFDLSRSALGPAGFYLPAMILVVGSAVIQYYQSMQLMPNTGQSRRLRDILREANDGKQAEREEVNAAVMKLNKWMLPVLILLFTVNIASALSLYWLVSGLVGYWQQSKVLGQDVKEMEADAPSKSANNVIEGEVLDLNKGETPSNRPRSKSKSKRRKR